MMSTFEYLFGWKRERWTTVIELGDGTKVWYPMFPLRRPEKSLGTPVRVPIQVWKPPRSHR